MKKPFCKAPWHSISLAPTGKIGPCCLIPFGLGDFKKGDSLESSWNGDAMKRFRQSLLDGNLAAGCLECKKKEEDGFTSMRALFEELSEGNPQPKTYQADASLEYFYHLDLSLSNKCNLKCRFCTPGNSTAWFKDRDRMFSQSDADFLHVLDPINQVVDIGVEDVAPFIDNLNNLKKVELKGGEPFMSKGNLALLEMLIDQGLAADIDLLYITNGTLLDENIFRLWQQFKSVELTFSIDGTGDVYRYVRGGRLTLEKDVVPILLKIQDQKLKNLRMNIHYTICVYNLFDIKNFLVWLKNSGIQSDFSFGLVDTPDFLSIRILPDEMINQAADELEAFGQFRQVRDLIRSLRDLTPAKNVGKLRSQFWGYTQMLDELRKESLLEMVPDLNNFQIER